MQMPGLNTVYSTKLPYVNWASIAPGTCLTFRFSDRNPSVYIIRVTKDNVDLIKALKPSRVMVWVYGHWSAPIGFLPFLTDSPKVRDFDLLMLRPENKRW